MTGKEDGRSEPRTTAPNRRNVDNSRLEERVTSRALVIARHLLTVPVSCGLPLTVSILPHYALQSCVSAQSIYISAIRASYAVISSELVSYVFAHVVTDVHGLGATQ